MKRLLFIFLPLIFLAGCSLPKIQDVVPPVAVLVYPYEGAVISGDININVQVSDDQEVKKVWFYVDGIELGESLQSPWALTLNVAGLTKKVPHVMLAAAQDKEGNIGYSNAIRFTIADTPDILPPTVQIVNPQGGQVVEGIVNITAYAEDERSIQKVAFFIDGDSVGTTAAYPYVYNWNTAGYSDSTSHTIFAKAFDGGNNVAVSPVIQVTVYPHTGPAGDNVAPFALFLYPVAGSTITGNVDVSADLRDNVGVSKAEFYVDGKLTKSQDNPPAPWVFNWNTSSKADTLLHSLYIKAYDAAGNVGTTGLMTVTIQ